mmetsp:Transcript_99257/g.320110  ORF Transcript_99257/g.320110 Transcript_99257/m.320110 type:complete len:344 (-) Transcript_99257:231-1262(-)
MEVLPTPASPMSTGLFFERRPKMRMVRLSCSSRPTRGSNSALLASRVRSLPNRNVVASSASSTVSLPMAPDWPGRTSPRSKACCTASMRSNSPFSTFAERLLQRRPKSTEPLPFSCCSTARSKWEVSTAGLPKDRAHSTVSSMACFEATVKGMSMAHLPLPTPRPRSFSSSARAQLMSTPRRRSTRLPISEPSAMTPTTSISVPTRSCPKRCASSCASTTARMVRSVKRSNILLRSATLLRCRCRWPSHVAPASGPPRSDWQPDCMLPWAAAPVEWPWRNGRRRRVRCCTTSNAARAPVAAQRKPVAVLLEPCSPAGKAACRGPRPSAATTRAFGWLLPCAGK